MTFLDIVTSLPKADEKTALLKCQRRGKRETLDERRMTEDGDEAKKWL
jgi:hypothetical protein